MGCLSQHRRVTLPSPHRSAVCFAGAGSGGGVVSGPTRFDSSHCYSAGPTLLIDRILSVGVGCSTAAIERELLGHAVIQIRLYWLETGLYRCQPSQGSTGSRIVLWHLVTST